MKGASQPIDLLLSVRRDGSTTLGAQIEDQIRRFWLASSSGRLEPGSIVRWAFKVAGAETQVSVV